MVRSLAIALILLILCGPGSSAQFNWTWQNRLPQGNILQAVAFPTPRIGIAVGAGGMILRSSNAGFNWYASPSGTYRTLWGLHFLNDSVGLAVGEYGTILKTTDAGVSWTRIPSGVTADLYTTHMFTSDSALACGAFVFLRTADGGGSWANDNTVPADAWTACDFPTSNFGYMIGDNYHGMRTTDRGRTWSAWTLSMRCSSVSFATAFTGMLAGPSGVVYLTTDAGANWQPMATGRSELLYSVRMMDANVAYACGERGLIIRTTDQGGTWTQLLTGVTYDLTSIAPLNDSTLAAVGDAGTVLLSFSNGDTFYDIATGMPLNVRGISFTSPDTGYAVAAGGRVLRSYNGGATWFSYVLGGSGAVELYAVHFADGKNGWACGDGGLIASTTDGGLSNWTGTHPTSKHLRDLAFATPWKALAVGNAGAIVRTVDGGQNWSQVNSGTGFDLRGVHWADTMKALAVGLHGTILRSIDGGASWQPRTIATSPELYAVCFSAPTEAWAAGTHGTLLHSTDSGTNWDLLTPPADVEFYAIRFTSRDTGYVAGSSGALFATTNGGSTWVRYVSGMGHDIYRLQFLTPSLGFLAGANGAILKTQNAGMPVTLVSFTAAQRGATSIGLRWETAEERNCAGFDVQRSNPESQAPGLDADWRIVASLPSKSVAGSGASYAWIDEALAPGRWRYRLVQRDIDGTIDYSPVVEATLAGPSSLRIVDLSPQPADRTALLRFTLPAEEDALVTVRNLLGETVHAQRAAAGTAARSAMLATDALPSGIYLIGISARGAHTTARLLVRH